MSALNMTDEQVYTVKEVAEKLKVTERTVRNMIRDGQIEVFYVRSERRIRQSALDAVMRGKKDDINGDDDRDPA